MTEATATECSMVERVARAMCRQSGIEWEKQSNTQRGYNLSLARAAIEAIREPTDDMRETGKQVIWRSGIVEGHLGSDSLIAGEIYTAMIDAALKENSVAEVS